MYPSSYLFPAPPPAPPDSRLASAFFVSSYRRRHDGGWRPGGQVNRAVTLHGCPPVLPGPVVAAGAHPPHLHTAAMLIHPADCHLGRIRGSAPYPAGGGLPRTPRFPRGGAAPRFIFLRSGSFFYHSMSPRRSYPGFAATGPPGLRTPKRPVRLPGSVACPLGRLGLQAARRRVTCLRLLSSLSHF